MKVKCGSASSGIAGRRQVRGAADRQAELARIRRKFTKFTTTYPSKMPFGALDDMGGKAI